MIKLKFFKNKWLVVLVLAGLVGGYYLGLSQPLELAANSMLNPVMGRFQEAGTYLSDKYQGFSEEEDKSDQIDRLEEQVRKLRVENAELKTVREENRILKEHLDFLEEQPRQHLMARVLSKGRLGTNSAVAERIIINKGSQDGLVKGLAVLSSQGVVIGKVAEVKAKSAEVYLSNNEDCLLAATVLGKPGTTGVTEGELGLTVKMGFIPQTENVDVEDMIITSGLEELIPRGLAIGRVVEVKKESNELWQTAFIEPLLEPGELVLVSVLLPDK